jgi:hypothetical protein
MNRDLVANPFHVGRRGTETGDSVLWSSSIVPESISAGAGQAIDRLLAEMSVAPVRNEAVLPQTDTPETSFSSWAILSAMGGWVS